MADPDERARLFLWAAQSGERHAQYEVGKYFESRSDAPSDRERAVKWYSLAARNGNEMGNQALFKLGLPDINGRMPLNATIPETAKPGIENSDALLALMVAVGVSIVVLSALDGGEATGAEQSGSDSAPDCSYGEVDLGGFCGPLACDYGEFNAGGFCMSYPDEWME